MTERQEFDWPTGGNDFVEWIAARLKDGWIFDVAVPIVADGKPYLRQTVYRP